MRTTAGMSVILAAALLAPSAAGGFELESREYKLMLDPQKFSGRPVPMQLTSSGTTC